MIRTLCGCLLLIVLLISHRIDSRENDDGLYLVHVICRHGERTPRKSYPKDPYKNEKYYPVGLGQLTKNGKLRMYNVGITLKERYQSFLGNFYLPWQVAVSASPFDRTQMTAQLVMAGMYPPKTAQIWNKNLTWQPIPITTLQPKQDHIFLPDQSCKKFTHLQDLNVQKLKDDGHYRKYDYIFKNLRKHTGLKIELPEDVMRLHDTLKCQKEWGLKIPDWANDYFPAAMEDVALQYWEDYAPTDELKKLGAGYMMKHIVDATSKKIDGNPNYNQMKFYLYSGHDSNIVPILELLDLYDPHIVPYGAYISIEVHKQGRDHIVKVYYQNYKSKRPTLMNLSACSKPCTFKEFAKVYKKYLPSSNDC